MKASRYILPVLPVLILFAAVQGQALISFLLRITPRWVAMPVLAAVLAWPTVADLPSLWERTKPDTRTLARAWIENEIQPGSMIVSESLGPTLLGPLTTAPLESSLIRRLQELPDKPPLFAFYQIPLAQVHPESTAPFYDPTQYTAVDFLITSSGVRERYEADPELFDKQNRFYEYLETNFFKVRSFGPTDGPGPELVLYRNPKVGTPFAQRQTVPDPKPLRGFGKWRSGQEPFFEYSQGLCYETFGFPEAAQISYAMGLMYSNPPPGLFVNLVLGVSRCLVTQKRDAVAVEFLGRAVEKATTTRDRQTIDRMMRTIMQRLNQ